MERELDAELRFHLDMQTTEYVRQGVAPEAARRSAQQLFGGVEGIKDDVRDTWLTRLVETLGQDVRYGVRSLRRQAGYALAVVVTMTLGIGANTAIFSVVNAVVLQPLPYERGEDLVLLRQARSGVDNTGFSLTDIDDIKTLSTSLDAVVEYHSMYFILLGGDEPERVAAGVVSWDYFQTLGVTPLLGRTFRAEDDGHEAPATILLSHEYWQRAFGGNRDVVGRVVEMNDRPHTIVGVLPDVPMYPQPNDVYMPRTACPFRANPSDRYRRGSGMASALGRRRAGPVARQDAGGPGGGRAASAGGLSGVLPGGPRLPADRSTAAPRVHAELRTHPPHPREHRRLRAPHRVRERRQPGCRADDAARPGACAAHGARREPRAAAAPVDHRKPHPRARRRRGRPAARVCRSGSAGRSTPRVSRCARQRSGSTRRSCSLRWRYPC